MGLSHPLSGLPDKELSEYLTFYLDSYIFHKRMAELSAVDSQTRKLHMLRATICSLRAREIETIIKDRKRAANERLRQELGRVGIGLSVFVN